MGVFLKVKDVINENLLPGDPISGDIRYIEETGKVMVWSANEEEWLDLGSAIVYNANLSPLTKKRWIGKDFELLKQEIEEYIGENFSNQTNDFLDSDMGQVIIQAVAYALSINSWYMDRQFDETIALESAKLRNSIAKHASQLYYKIKGASPARVWIKVILNKSYNFKVIFPMGYQVEGNGIIYEFKQAVTFAVGVYGSNNFQLVEACQVESRGQTFVSNGIINQTFKIPMYASNKYLVMGEGNSDVNRIIVKVNNVEWEERDFLDIVDEVPHYMVDYYQSPPVLKFGDGIVGNLPPNGAEITIGYKETLGTKGNVSVGELTKVKRSLVIKGNVIDAIFTNEASSFALGTFPETMSSIKANAPKFTASQGRAVSRDDFIALAIDFWLSNNNAKVIVNAIVVRGTTDFMFIKQIVNVLNAEGYEELATNFEMNMQNILVDEAKTNVVNIVVLKEDANGDYISPTTESMQSLQTYLMTVCEGTVTAIVSGAEEYIVKVKATISVEVVENISSDVIDELKEDLEVILKGRNFGESFRLSELYGVVYDYVTGNNSGKLKYGVCKIDGATRDGVDVSSKIDSNGDLIITQDEVVVLDTNGLTMVEL